MAQMKRQDAGKSKKAYSQRDELFSKRKVLTDKGQEFKSSVLYPTRRSLGKISVIVEKAIKEKWEIEQTIEECKKYRLKKEEMSAVLNLAHVYWPAFELESNLREDVDKLLDYLKKEPPEHLKNEGYTSYLISLLDKDGMPAGIVIGAIIDAKRLFENPEIKWSEEQKVILDKPMCLNFISYRAISDNMAGKGVGNLLRKIASDYIEEITGRVADFTLGQVDRPEDLDGERAKQARFVKNLMQEKYGYMGVKGLVNVEVIEPEYHGENEMAPIPAPEKMPKLDLLITLGSGEKQFPLEDLRNMLKALYTYYGNYPGRKIEGTGEESNDAYVEYSMRNVVHKDGIVKLEKI